jgi:N-acetylmuramoyl-L-alanine amidase
MLSRPLAALLAAFALLAPAAATDADLARIARASGAPTIPGLNMVWLAPWGDVTAAHAWRNIIVHQTEGPAGSARMGALAQSKNPTRRGVTIWVETDGTVYWAVPESLVPTHGDGANRNDNAFIDNSATDLPPKKWTGLGGF